jgi:hypothetical protein
VPEQLADCRGIPLRRLLDDTLLERATQIEHRALIKRLAPYQKGFFH